jgi:hypothetical protein
MRLRRRRPSRVVGLHLSHSCRPNLLCRPSPTSHRRPHHQCQCCRSCLRCPHFRRTPFHPRHRHPRWSPDQDLRAGWWMRSTLRDQGRRGMRTLPERRRRFSWSVPLATGVPMWRGSARSLYPSENVAQLSGRVSGLADGSVVCVPPNWHTGRGFRLTRARDTRDSPSVNRRTGPRSHVAPVRSWPRGSHAPAP